MGELTEGGRGRDTNGEGGDGSGKTTTFGEKTKVVAHNRTNTKSGRSVGEEFADEKDKGLKRLHLCRGHYGRTAKEVMRGEFWKARDRKGKDYRNILEERKSNLDRGSWERQGTLRISMREGAASGNKDFTLQMKVLRKGGTSSRRKKVEERLTSMRSQSAKRVRLITERNREW